MTVATVSRTRCPAKFGNELLTTSERQKPMRSTRYLLSRIPDGLANGTRPRHLRCILYLAKGGRNQLEEWIKLCVQDTRDVMLHQGRISRQPGDDRPVKQRDRVDGAGGGRAVTAAEERGGSALAARS